MSRRILEGFFIFTLLPVTTLILLVYRYYLEGKIDGHLISETLYIGIFSITIAIIVAIFLGKLLKSDTHKITQKLHQIKNGNFEKDLDLQRVDELGAISHGINYMRQGLIERVKIQEGFAKFVDPFIASRYINEMINKQSYEINFTGETNHVAILMCDIRNFTQITESLTPQETVQLLNIFFTSSVSIVKKHKGIINKFIGDAIMVVYGLDDENHKNDNALKTAQELYSALEQINITLKNNNLPSINIGIGLHSGEVSSGYVGDTQRLEFTVIGSTVNIAARIESQTKTLHKNILFSEVFNNNLVENFNTFFVDTVQLKGVSETVSLYSIH